MSSPAARRVPIPPFRAAPSRKDTSADPQHERSSQYFCARAPTFALARPRQATEADLLEWSGEIGSDISVFFSTGAAYCTGRGEAGSAPPDFAPEPSPPELRCAVRCARHCAGSRDEDTAL